MKILFIAPHLSTGGMPQYLYKQMEAISSDCEVYCVEWDNVTGGVLVVQRNRIANLLGNKLITLDRDRYHLFKIIEEIDPDIIHLQEIPELFMDYNVALKLYNKDRKYTIVETSHDSSFNINNKLHFPDKFAMVSQYQIETYKPLNIPCELVEYPIEYFKRTKTREEILNQLGLDPSKKHVITVGLFTPRKNQAEVIEYARQLQDYPIQFHFIGNQADNFKHYWEPLMKDFPSNCRWWNERSDVENFYQMADLFLFASRGSNTDKETMPLVIREAISWQVPSLIYNLDVYLNYFDKHKNISYLDFNNKTKNIKDIVEKLGMEINKIDQYFDIKFDNSDNKIHIIHKKYENKKYKISIKDKDSNAPMYWFEAEFGNGSYWWVIPVPIHIFNFYLDPNFGSFLIEFYDENNVFLFDKTIFIKESKNKLKLNVKNPFDCLFNNYNEMFVDNKYDCYELDKMETVLDIGANSGLFSLLCINKGAKKVYAFEPNQESIINLKNITDGLNVEIIDKAVYTKDEDLTFYIDPSNTTIGSISEDHLSIHGNSTKKIIVPAISLKTFMFENNLEKISLVKMDIEGAEYEIIENLENEIFEKIDNFLIEYHDNEDKRVKKLIDKLIERGFNIDQIRNQNTKNNDDIKDSYMFSPIGTIFAKKPFTKQTINNTELKLFIDNNVAPNKKDLASLVNKMFPYGKGVEIGVLKGDYSKIILERWHRGTLYLVDTWRHLDNYIDMNGQDDKYHYDCLIQTCTNIKPWQDRAHIIRMDSIKSANMFPDEHFDFIYIDADHSYEGVVRDLEAWWPKIKKGGLFCGDDYIPDDGDIWMTGQGEPVYAGKFGVRKAVNEFIAKKDLILYETTEEPYWRQWYTFKPF